MKTKHSFACVLLACMSLLVAGCPVDPNRAEIQSGSTRERIPQGASGLAFITSFGGAGAGEGLFKRIGGLAAYDGRLYVADQQTARVQVFDYSGKLLDVWGSGLDVVTYGVTEEQLALNLTATEEELLQPVILQQIENRTFFRVFDIAVDNGEILLLNNFHSRAKTSLALMNAEVLRFSTTGELLRIHDIDSLLPVSIACDELGKQVIVGDVLNSCFQVFMLEDNSFVASNRPGFNRDLSDYLELVYREKTPEMRRQRSDEWTNKGTKTGEFNLIAGVAYYDGMVLAADMNNRRIQVFREDGSFLHAVMGSGPGLPTLFSRPFDIDVTKNGVVYLSDQSESTPGVTAFSSKFNPLYKLMHQELSSPGYIEVADDGYVFVTDINSNKVFVFGPKSEMLEAGRSAAQEAEGAP